MLSHLSITSIQNKKRFHNFLLFVELLQIFQLRRVGRPTALLSASKGKFGQICEQGRGRGEASTRGRGVEKPFQNDVCSTLLLESWHSQTMEYQDWVYTTTTRGSVLHHCFKMVLKLRDPKKLLLDNVLPLSTISSTQTAEPKNLENLRRLDCYVSEIQVIPSMNFKSTKIA